MLTTLALITGTLMLYRAVIRIAAAFALMSANREE